MRILGLESSCDETACAVVEDDAQNRIFVMGDVISSQVEIHAAYGGVVPEIASRHHLLNLLPIIEQALTEADIGLDQIDAIAVTRGPGLVGSLLVAVQAAKAIAFARNIPVVGVHHLEGHLLAAFLHEGKMRSTCTADPSFPHLGLLVSGGHTALVRVEGFGRYEVLGATRDDACGEAFDKVGKIMGLGYPAGPMMDRLSQTGNPSALKFPQAMLGPKAGLDFSFSGMKTALSEHLASRGVPEDPQEIADLCASFQAALIEQLIRKTNLALEQNNYRALVLSGGVASNRALRAQLLTLCQERAISFHVPPPRWCTDNAAMIACAGYHRLRRGLQSDLTLNALASLPFSD